MEEEIEARKKTTLLEEVHFFHDALPELSTDDISLETKVLGTTLRAPILISGMTGGSERALPINKSLAKVAQDFGFAFGLGSQRAMLNDPDLAYTYDIREVAPTVFLIGNIGAVQAAQSSTQDIEKMVGRIDANALCIHLNPAQELIQPKGDRDFRGCLDAIARLVDNLSIPVIVKETGCGFSPKTLDKIKSTNAKYIEISGAGGTTWVGVETKRSSGLQQKIGELLWDWGVPTAPSIHYSSKRGFGTLASGGIRNIKDIAAALSLGADLCGMARPWLVAQSEGRERALAEELIEGLKMICCLTGCKSPHDLRTLDRVNGPNLERWMNADR